MNNYNRIGNLKVVAIHPDARWICNGESNEYPLFTINEEPIMHYPKSTIDYPTGLQVTVGKPLSARVCNCSMLPELDTPYITGDLPHDSVININLRITNISDRALMIYKHTNIATLKLHVIHKLDVSFGPFLKNVQQNIYDQPYQFNHTHQPNTFGSPIEQEPFSKYASSAGMRARLNNYMR
jgi:hypothetical protein